MHVRSQKDAKITSMCIQWMKNRGHLFSANLSSDNIESAAQMSAALYAFTWSEEWKGVAYIYPFVHNRRWISCTSPLDPRR